MALIVHYTLNDSQPRQPLYLMLILGKILADSI